MRCKTCDYPLWNLPARKCPECGADFKPSDFHFVPNSVRYHCPHCQQCYYGTTPEGHLIPRAFNCVTCGQRIDMDEMLLFPAEGVQEEHTAADVMPWLQRRQLGWFKGWIRTIGMAMAAPHKLMRAIPLEGGLMEACFFLLVTHTVIALFGACVPLLVVLMVSGGSARGGAMPMLAGAATALVVGSIGTLVIATLWALLTHGLLKITGGAQRSMGRTMQAIYYSSGANIVMAVPCIGPYCGGYFTWIWWLVSAILMVMEGQKVRGLRATMCVGAGPAAGILAFAAYIMVVFYLISSMGSAMSPAVVGGRYAPTAEAQTIHTGILAYAMANGGQGPGHAIELVVDNYATASSFISWQIGHDEANVTLPGSSLTLDGFQYLPSNRMRMTATAMSQAQPAGIVAHRLGDVVLTYHGMNLNNADPGLWIAVIDPDPGQVSGGGLSMMPTAVQVDGTTVMLSPTGMAAQMQQQNALRAKYGLVPLPDLSTITNSTPAVSGASVLGPGPP